MANISVARHIKRVDKLGALIYLLAILVKKEFNPELVLRLNFADKDWS